MKKKPNVLFLLADDMRYDTIHAMGNDAIITPNLDSIFQSGTAFTNSYIPGGTCAAICMPSRAMINTGRGLYGLNDNGSYIPGEHITLGETFQKNGYDTFGVGKWHNGFESFARSFSCGSEIFFGGMYDHWKVPVYDYDDTGEYVNTYNDVMNPGYNNNIMPVRANHVTWGKHSTDLFADAACNWIRDRESDDPFYMYVAYMAPHDPRTVPQEFFDMYRVEDIEVPENFAGEHPFDYGQKNVRDERLEEYPRKPEAIQKHIRDYYAMITHLDASIGRILDALKEKGLFEDTIILFTADNGLSLGQHGLMGKASLYEHDIKLPLAISGPDIPKNRKVDERIFLSDIYPTLCEYAGASVPDSVKGVSFKPLIDGAKNTLHESMYYTFKDKVRGLREGDFKLLLYRSPRLPSGERIQLFNVKEDPFEMTDLSEQTEMKPIISKMMASLKAQAETNGDMKHETGDRFWFHIDQIDDECWGFK